MIKYVQEGCHIDYTPSSAVAVGVGVVLGTMFGVTTKAIAANELGALAVVGGFEFVKTGGGGITFAQGAKGYFDEAAPKATSNAAAGANPLIGLATAAAVDADTTVNVRLQPQGA